MLLRIETEAGDVVLCVLRSDRLQNPYGHQLFRSGQRGAHADRAIEGAVEVSRLPVHRSGFAGVDGQRRVVDDGGWRETLFQRRRINERLEARTGLPARLGYVVVLVAVEVESTDHGADCAVVGVYGHQRGFNLRQLHDFPAAFAVGLHPDQRAAAQPEFVRRAVADHTAGELQPVAGDGDEFAALAVGL